MKDMQDNSAINQSAPWKGRIPYAVGIAILLIILSAGYYALGMKPAATTTTGTANSSYSSTINVSSTTIPVSSSTATVSSTTMAANFTTSIPSSGIQNASNGGPGQSYMSKDEAISLLGPGGKYSVIYNSSPPQSGILKNNVTGYWIVNYSVSSSTATKRIIAVVYQSTDSPHLYSAAVKQLSNYSVTMGAINAMSDGLVYSYATSVPTNPPGSELIGYKHGDAVAVLSPSDINQTKLVSIIAADLP
jgi:hypothetical protein